MSAEHDARVAAFVTELEHFIDQKFAVLQSLSSASSAAATARRRRLLSELASDRKEITQSVAALTWCKIETTNPNGDSK